MAIFGHLWSSVHQTSYNKYGPILQKKLFILLNFPFDIEKNILTPQIKNSNVFSHEGGTSLDHILGVSSPTIMYIVHCTVRYSHVQSGDIY